MYNVHNMDGRRGGSGTNTRGFPKIWNPLTAALQRGPQRMPEGYRRFKVPSVSLEFELVYSKCFLFKFKNNVNINSKYYRMRRIYLLDFI